MAGTRRPPSQVEALEPPVGDLWLSVWGSGPGDVYVAGSLALLHTTDNGESWSILKQREATTAEMSGDIAVVVYTAVWGTGPDDVYVGMSDGTVLRTSDRGATWRSEQVFVEKQVRRFTGGPEGQVFVLTDEGGVLAAAAGGP